MASNVGNVHSNFNLIERIWSSGIQRANFKVHYEIGPLWATSYGLKKKVLSLLQYQPLNKWTHIAWQLIYNEVFTLKITKTFI